MSEKRYRIFDDYNRCFWDGYYETLEEANKRIDEVFGFDLFKEIEAKVDKDLICHILLRRQKLRVVDMAKDDVFCCGGCRYVCYPR